jgi:hypothetical protein
LESQDHPASPGFEAQQVAKASHEGDAPAPLTALSQSLGILRNLLQIKSLSLILNFDPEIVPIRSATNPKNLLGMILVAMLSCVGQGLAEGNPHSLQISARGRGLGCRLTCGLHRSFQVLQDLQEMSIEKTLLGRKLQFEAEHKEVCGGLLPKGGRPPWKWFTFFVIQAPCFAVSYLVWSFIEGFSCGFKNGNSWEHGDLDRLACSGVPS